MKTADLVVPAMVFYCLLGGALHLSVDINGDVSAGVFLLPLALLGKKRRKGW